MRGHRGGTRRAARSLARRRQPWPGRPSGRTGGLRRRGTRPAHRPCRPPGAGCRGDGRATTEGR
ncbi:hypothetical protein C5746_42865 [Streptomyces atratus]|uniref:Uncharacterized protein n=1 Tax=Streptomyces atratus TaxID=1893 RepID=A0A2Z5JPX1_STRAR|nr:hypothetical protein C5746_00370 [Streptomyces atratus]AXE82460.1 hypothetical protein C5746_42865 [Streptomyces atratus]